MHTVSNDIGMNYDFHPKLFSGGPHNKFWELPNINFGE